MKKIIFAFLTVVVAMGIMSGCGRVSDPGVQGSGESETVTNDRGTLDFELSDNLTLEFDPAGKTAPEKAYTAYASRYIYDYSVFKSVFGLENENITVKEEEFNPAFDHYFGEDDTFSYAFNIGYSGQDRIQNGLMTYGRSCRDINTHMLSASGALGVSPEWRRGIEPYKGEKALEGLDLLSAKAKFDGYISSFELGDNTSVSIENVFSISKEDMVEYFVSPLNRNRLFDPATGEYLTETPSEYVDALSNGYYFTWRQYINDIPIATYSWGARFAGSTQRLASQEISGYITSDGEEDLTIDRVYRNVRLGECREIVPFSVALKKVNDIVSLSMTDTKYSIFGAELCYCGYYTDTYEVYFHPMWVIVVDEYWEDSQRWNTFSKNIYAIDAFTGEIIQNSDIPVLE